MELNQKVNYLNNQEVFSLVEKIDIRLFNTTKKSFLLKELKKRHLLNKKIENIILSFPNKTKEYIDCEDFFNVVNSSIVFQNYFSSLHIKGFSFKTCKNISGFPYYLKKSVNLRYALIFDENLFYPQRVKNFLMKKQKNHVFANGRPAIAFALGKEINDKLYIITLQSDLPLFTYSFLRGHFKDWSKLLFHAIVESKKKCIKSFYLCPSKFIISTCRRDYDTPEKVPKSWKYIYDNTAKFFNMNIVKSEEFIDLQLHPKRKKIPNRIFYQFEADL